MSELTGNYIGGEWIASISGETFASINPANRDEIVGEVAKSSGKDVDRAVLSARSALYDWRSMPAPKRGNILFRAAEILSRRKEEIARLCTREMGKVIAEGRGDVQEAIDMAYYMAGEGRRLAGETVPSELPMKDAKSVRVPVGVFGLITPWNFPTAIPSWKILPALICGNTVVFKPSSYTPVSAAAVVKALEEAGIPPGVLNMVCGSGEDVGEYLVSHEGVDAVSFTGSSKVGLHVESICGRLHRPVATETGGKNSMIVMDDADIDLALEGALWGAFGTTGQRCTATSRVILQSGIYEEFIERLIDKAKKIKVGDGLLESTDMGPLINEQQCEKIFRYIKIGEKEGGEIVLGGGTAVGAGIENGFFVEPTIFINVKPEMRIAQEEIFGPVLSVLKADDYEEAVEIANDVAYGLSSSIYTSNLSIAARAENDLDTGLVYINAPTIGAEIQLPFGGTKATGIGPREAGGRGGALDLYSKWKVIYRDYSGSLQKAQIN